MVLKGLKFLACLLLSSLIYYCKIKIHPAVVSSFDLVIRQSVVSIHFLIFNTKLFLLSRKFIILYMFEVNLITTKLPSIMYSHNLSIPSLQISTFNLHKFM